MAQGPLVNKGTLVRKDTQGLRDLFPRAEGKGQPSLCVASILYCISSRESRLARVQNAYQAGEESRVRWGITDGVLDGGVVDVIKGRHGPETSMALTGVFEECGFHHSPPPHSARKR